MAKLLIDLPDQLKAKLYALRRQGYTMNGFIVALLERELGNQQPVTRTGGRLMVPTTDTPTGKEGLTHGRETS